MGKFVAAIAVVLFLVVASPGFSAVVYPEHPQQNDPILLLDYWSAGYPGGVNGDNGVAARFTRSSATKGEAWKTFCVERGVRSRSSISIRRFVVPRSNLQLQGGQCFV